MPQDKPDPDPPDDAPSPRNTGVRLGAGFDSQPIFRVVEVVRDERGRLRHEGKIWHTDLGRMRQFGRALAANTASHRVIVADAAGNVLEEIPVTPAEARETHWSDWQAIPLPPLPPRTKAPAPPKRKPLAATPAALGLDAAVTESAPPRAGEAAPSGPQTDLTLP